MRLLDDARFRALALLGLAATLGGCAIIPGGGNRSVQVSDISGRAMETVNGPQADYPLVLGDPFTVDGKEYVPADTASYDSVGYVTIDREGGGVTAAHRTLPLPSYVEVTSLDTGKTILVRAERRGPMTGAYLIGLSSGARAGLEITEGSPVRVRRVNPPETHRAELRAGRAAPQRMDTPRSLVSVLRRKLPARGSASLRQSAGATQARVTRPVPAATQTPRELPPVARQAAPVSRPALLPDAFRQAFSIERKTVATYPLKPLDGPAASVPRHGVRSDHSSARPVPVRAQHTAPAPMAANGDFVVQAAAFSSKANAEQAAGRLGGFVTRAGRYYRVRTGPYATRGQAEAALAKVRAAGYSDARVFTAG